MPTTQVDHIVPKRNGGTDDRDNLQGLCEPCHSRKTRYEMSYRVEGETTTRVHLVCGPPGSGKSTFVLARMDRGDLRVDLDWITAALSGQPLHDKPAEVLTFARCAQSAVLERLRTHSEVRTAWVISGAPSARAREALAERVGADTVTVLEVDATECWRRLMADEDRSSRSEGYQEAIDNWWANYRRRDGEHVVTS